MDPVIVVGAGPVGLALALALTRYEVPSMVLDEATAPEGPRTARTVVLRPDTGAFLTRLGCGPALEAAGTRWTAWRTVRRRHLQERVEFDAAHPAPLHVPQHALTQALRAALSREGAVRMVTSSRLDGLEQDAHGVSARTRGPQGAWWRGSYLVGCDGARSTVRKLLEIRFPGRTAVERHAVAALRTELPWYGEGLLHRAAAGPDARSPVSEVSARPLPGGVWRLDWLLPPGRDLVTPEVLLAHVRATLGSWAAHPPPGAEVAGASDRYAFQDADGDPGGPYELLDTGVHIVHHRLARHWRRGRAFLAGDAAHLLGALGSQGLDEGLRDAENLAWKLALAWHQGATDALLDSYQAERRGAVTARLRAADRALPLLRGGDRGRWRRILPGAARGHTALLTDGHLGRGPLGAPPAYVRSPLAPAVEPDGTVTVGTEPGEPVADVPVTAQDGALVRLRERLGRGLLVVLVAPGTGVWDRRHWMSAGLMPALADAVAALPVPAEVLVAEEYPSAPAHTVLVVRPDGHLVAALAGVRADELYACADAVRGGPSGRAAASRERVSEGDEDGDADDGGGGPDRGGAVGERGGPAGRPVSVPGAVAGRAPGVSLAGEAVVRPRSEAVGTVGALAAPEARERVPEEPSGRVPGQRPERVSGDAAERVRGQG
ncbi:FAD-dependent monooxygenase [Streptomyces sp. NPDC003077]|uniref:FAD-dependent oxidoreductase n=1 Tax=Streptomyces sp. NPDC003077 TaxID=3154443 RepID=UPI0033A5E911